MALPASNKAKSWIQDLIYKFTRIGSDMEMENNNNNKKNLNTTQLEKQNSYRGIRSVSYDFKNVSSRGGKEKGKRGDQYLHCRKVS